MRLPELTMLDFDWIMSLVPLHPLRKALLNHAAYRLVTLPS